MLLDDIRAKLSAAGVFNGTTWICYSGYLPDDQDQVIALFETPGLPPDTLGRENEQPSFQVRIRGTRLDYATARAKAQAAFDCLQDAQAGAGLLTGYAFIQAQHSGPLYWTDDKQRPNFTYNFRVHKTA